MFLRELSPPRNPKPHNWEEDKIKPIKIRGSPKLNYKLGVTMQKEMSGVTRLRLRGGREQHLLPLSYLDSHSWPFLVPHVRDPLPQPPVPRAICDRKSGRE